MIEAMPNGINSILSRVEPKPSITNSINSYKYMYSSLKK